MTESNTENIRQDFSGDQQDQSKFERLLENQQQQMTIFSNSVAECMTNMGENLIKVLQEGFKECSEDLNRNRAQQEQEKPSTSKDTKGKRKIGPASVEFPMFTSATGEKRCARILAGRKSAQHLERRSVRLCS